MKPKLIISAMATFLILSTSLTFAQSNKGKLGVGLNAGAQRVYGDRKFVSFAPGAEGFLTYRFLPFADVALGIGYNQLKVQFVKNGGSSTTDIFNFDLRSNFEVISSGMFRPYVSVGAGLLRHKVRHAKPAMSSKLSGSFIGGGGLKVQLNPKLNFFVGADYRFTTTDLLDNPLSEGKSNDGFLSARTGITYYFNGEYDRTPQVIASERAPFYELDSSEENPNADSYPYASGESKDMQEYIKLKSRVDALSNNIATKDQEISDSRNSLNQRKRKLSSLEQQASNQPSKRLISNSSMSGFTEIYKEGLANYYNKNYTEAISFFQILLQRYSNHNLASSCQYWIGNSLYALHRYQDAIEAFNKVLTYDRSLKRDDALFYLGKSYMEMGLTERAKDSFSRLITGYIHSEYVSEARALMATL